MAIVCWGVLMALVPPEVKALESFAAPMRVDVAANVTPHDQHFGEDVESDESLPSSSHRKLMPGQKPDTSLTAPPSGYDAKHINRLWGRFRGAKVNTKAAKRHK